MSGPMTRSLALLLLASSLSVGCGGSVASVAESSDGGITSDSEKPKNLAGPLEGSYDLAFRDVTITPGQNGNTPPTTLPPSNGASARLDVRARSGGGYEAVITSRFGDPSAFKVEVTGAALILEGGRATVRGTSSSSYASDSWTSLTFARGASGSLTGAFFAKGDEDVSQGDVLWTNKASAKGTHTRDVTAPETKPIFYSNGPANALLPWDPIRVRIAEPTDAASLVKAFTLNAPDAHPASLEWTIEGGTSDADWAGAIQAKGLRKNWDPPAAGTLLITRGLTDRVGNASSETTSAVSFLSLAMNQTSQDFDTDSITVGTWGDSALTFLGGFTGSDPSCEHGGCVKMGVFPATVCGAPRIGIAGILAKSATKVLVRYRVLVKSTLAPPDQVPQVYGVSFAVDVANPGSEAKTTSAVVASADLKPLASPQFGMSWATDWTTLEAASPAASAPSVGFTVRAGANPSAGCGGPAPPPIDTIVLIDSVDAG